ncbi:AhpC/TSA family protein [Mucilaginibacter terrenus]|uniref:AhpC/TSA family protein n=1 Tax=Mucilaginibacter terrenus TaxID=2482727 RepID=A0A3E2NVC3_9SPHI|nr:TlpA disulfide reductase family protein [Mucilaginibacter terrenus]RFZ84964.1 AhpC/TSA family protein [Mucilaginibacter terrenus]
MKLRNLILTVSIAALFAVSCSDKNSFTISGTINNPGKDKKIMLMGTDTTGVIALDSTMVDDQGKFSFKHSTPYANLFKLRYNGTIFDVVAANGDDIKITTDAADVTHSYEITGSDPSEKIKEFNKIANVYGEKNSKLSDEYTAKSEALGRESDSLLAIYMPMFQKNIAEYSQEVLKFVEANKHSLAGFYAATSLDQQKYEQQLVSYADEIKDDFKDNPGVQMFRKQMEGIKPISIGHKAPEFSTAGIDGKQVKLSDYKGKYVMIDFWASWCLPCRQENPNVLKQYKKFHDKGFNILGISLDESKSAWQGAINADKLNWAHVSDLQRFEGATERLYRIEAIPSNFIIDPQGTIVAKNVFGADLESFLNKTFK